MMAIINKKLTSIEQQYDIKILFACETLSRAWDFPSPDRDYDVRMIYKHDLDWYLTLADKKDYIEFISPDSELDVTVGKILWSFDEYAETRIVRYLTPFNLKTRSFPDL